jgi:DNA polymerase III subunit delta'
MYFKLSKFFKTKLLKTTGIKLSMSPGRELDLLRRIDTLAKSSRQEQEQLLKSLLAFFLDTIRCAHGTHTATDFINADVSEAVSRFAKNFGQGDFESATKEIEAAIHNLNRNANPLLTLTALAIKLSAAFRRPAPSHPVLKAVS